jgi:rRNA maturation protein Rpf1
VRLLAVWYREFTLCLVCAQGERLMTILKHLFPVPKADSKRVITFSNDSDFISFRHHTYKKTVGSKDVELVEVRARSRSSRPVAS